MKNSRTLTLSHRYFYRNVYYSLRNRHIHSDLDLTATALEDVIVAYEKYGKPMDETLRLVVPGRWGYKWIKWLTRIELMDYDFKGRYESRGFPDDAWVTNVQPPGSGFPTAGPYNP